MSKYYILVLEEGIKTFSVLGHGQECKFTFALKGQTDPFSELAEGDKIIGYISNDTKRFEYLFEAKQNLDANESVLIKLFETTQGPSLETLSEDVKETLYKNEQVQSFIEVDAAIYQEIVNAMLVANKKSYAVEQPENDVIDESVRNDDGTNVLLYGVPGSGKSWTIEHEYCKDESCMERLVFHPDYMYSDFVGQILPVVKDDKVRYEFSPGPFTKLLRRAYLNPDKSFYLIIEEINRGNAPAIFGEIFQLLDRKDEDGDGFKKGTSEYGITNANIASVVYENEEAKVRIPSNMSIIGTMNTSDQNVFTLDTAFQRRWIMRMIPNTFRNHKFAEDKILDTEVSWKQFCEAINEEILRRNNITSSEDKRLGAYFISAVDLKFETASDNAPEMEKIKVMHHNHRFAEKVLKYLWDDAFKFSHQDTFNTKSYSSLERIIDAFMDPKIKGNERFRVFHENLRKMIIEGIANGSNEVLKEDTENLTKS